MTTDTEAWLLKNAGYCAGLEARFTKSVCKQRKKLYPKSVCSGCKGLTYESNRP